MRIIFLLIVLVASCAHQQKQISSTDKIRYDLDMTVNGARIIGMGVLDGSAPYNIKIESEGDLDVVTITNCHKEIIHEGTPKRKGLFRGIFGKKNKSYSFVHNPEGLELREPCPLILSAFSKDGRHSFGYLSLGSSEATRKATLQCNGRTQEYIGSSICQAKFGLIQKISFDDDVLYSSDCAPDGKASEFEIEIKKGFCHHSFMDRNRKFHDLTTYGYETFYYRR